MSFHYSISAFLLACALNITGLSATETSHEAAQKKLNIVVIGKTKNDSFYEQSFDGCQKFAQSVANLNCIYDGPKDFQNIRSQALIIESYIKQGVDGFLISTTDSNFLVNRVLKQVKEANIPVITFDSDCLMPIKPIG
jgi:ribose transport system substrate-binding protein